MSYIDKITNKDTGESRVISPAAEAVRVSNENYEGENLDEVLDEVAHAIEDAGSGDGTVTGVKIGSTTYEPTDGVVDLSSPMSNKVDKNGTDSLMTAAEHTKLTNLPTADQLTTQMNAKANDNAVVKTISVNGGTPQQPDNGNVNIIVEGSAGEDGKSAYQSYLDTTSDNPKKTEAEWVASLHGQDGVQSGDDVVVVHDLDGEPDNLEQEQVAVLGADVGQMLGSMLNALEDEMEDIEDGAGYEISIVGDELVINSRNTPTVNVSAVGNNSLSAKVGNTATTSFYVSGRKLTSAIQISVSDLTNWSVSPTSLSPVNGKVAQTLVTITYQPASGSTAGATQPCTVTISSTGAQSSPIAMTGTVATAPSITLTPPTQNIPTDENTPATGTINVKGAALEGNISLAVSGTAFTLSPNSVDKDLAQTSEGVNVTITFNGDAAANETITATTADGSGTATATASVTGTVVGRKAAGETWDDANGKLTYTVLTDTSTVSVKQKSVPACTGAITIPAFVNDDNNISYRVIAVANEGFYNNTNITSVTMADGGAEIIGIRAFSGCTSLASLTLPNTMKYLGDQQQASTYQKILDNTLLTRLVIPASMICIFPQAVTSSNNSLVELEVKGMESNTDGGGIANHAFKSNINTVYTDIALKTNDDPLAVLPNIAAPSSYGGSFNYGQVSGDTSNYWYIYKDGDNNNQKVTLVVPDDESVTAYEALRTKSGIANVKGWGFFNIVKKQSN